MAQLLKNNFDIKYYDPSYPWKIANKKYPIPSELDTKQDVYRIGEKSAYGAVYKIGNDDKYVLDEIYLGKLRYNNMFVVSNWQYDTTHDSIYYDYYEMEKRKLDNGIRYSIWNNQIIQNIRDVYNNNKPITELENETYDIMSYVIKWIDEMLLKYNNIKIHFVFLTILD